MSNYKKCVCGKTFHKKFTTCPFCGTAKGGSGGIEGQSIAAKSAAPSLIACPVCGRNVASQAQSCPQCGHPFQSPQSTDPIHRPESAKKKQTYGCGTLFLVFFVIILAIGLFDDNSSHQKNDIKPSKPKEVVFNSAWDGSVYQINRYLEGVLKDPDSFQAIEWSPVQKVDSPNYTFMVRCKYRAKNSFGGYVIENQLFYLDAQGNVVTATNLD